MAGGWSGRFNDGHPQDVHPESLVPVNVILYGKRLFADENRFRILRWKRLSWVTGCAQWYNHICLYKKEAEGVTISENREGHVTTSVERKKRLKMLFCEL